MRVGLQAWGSEGDIAPFTALAAGLVRVGHEVKLVVTDNAGRDYQALGERFGFQVISVAAPQAAHPLEAERIWRQIVMLGNPIEQAKWVMRYGFDPVVEPMYEAAQELCAWSDAVVGHFFVYPLQVAAERTNRPSATLNIVHNTIPSAFICPPGFPALGPVVNRLGWGIARRLVNRIFLPRVNALRVREGLRPDRDVMTETWAAQRLNLVAVSPTVVDRPPDWDARHELCGFLAPRGGLQGDDLSPELEEFLAKGSPPVFLTFGSMLGPQDHEFLKETLAIWEGAVRIAGCRAIFQTPTEVMRAGSNSRVLFVGWTPYLKAFPRCAAVVHHGGAGTTQATLLSGCPSVVVAHVSDQFFWGSELKRLGVAALTLRRKGLTARKLATAIRRTLARAELAPRAAELGERMAGEDGVGTALRLIERRLLTAAR